MQAWSTQAWLGRRRLGRRRLGRRRLGQWSLISKFADYIGHGCFELASPRFLPSAASSAAVPAHREMHYIPGPLTLDQCKLVDSLAPAHIDEDRSLLQPGYGCGVKELKSRFCDGQGIDHVVTFLQKLMELMWPIHL